MKCQGKKTQHLSIKHTSKQLLSVLSACWEGAFNFSGLFSDKLSNCRCCHWCAGSGKYALGWWQWAASLENGPLPPGSPLVSWYQCPLSWDSRCVISGATKHKPQAISGFSWPENELSVHICPSCTTIQLEPLPCTWDKISFFSLPPKGKTSLGSFSFVQDTWNFSHPPKCL